MRIKISGVKFSLIVVMLAAGVLFNAPRTRAQNPDTIPADVSTAKSKELFRQAIEGLGGAAYLGVRDSDCSGRLSQFGPLTGELVGLIQFRELRISPDKLRREYSKKGVIIDVFNGNNAWSLDKGGVEDVDAVVVAGFQSGLQTTLDSVLRLRLSEPGMYFRYGGDDVVSLKPVDWAEITDSEDRTFRLAVDRATHLPVQFVVNTRNPTTRDVSVETTTYSNWHFQDGVQTPFQFSRERDGKRVSQTFYSECKYNTGVSPSLFTRESLEQRWRDTGHKVK
ncbi:MAG TPA: hypothetical protein VKR82_04890 [Candidatus Acidoferrales bacterium]|nr:hypothetical protein [Candidatus Acidoferrales bacterium]